MITTDHMTSAHLGTHLGIQLDEHLITSTDIPALTGLQRQGDIIIIPIPITTATTPLTTTGEILVRGEGGNTHAVHKYTGNVTYDPSNGERTIGLLTVGENSSAVISHPEHGFLAIGTGSYEIRRQREQADEIMTVVD